MKNRILTLLFVLGLLSLTESCTKLKETVLDESSVTGLTEKQIADGTIAPVYAQLPNI
ncbi:MAG: hypothetical protein RJB31_1948, partial [Bacteroidota bacterium]